MLIANVQKQLFPLDPCSIHFLFIQNIIPWGNFKIITKSGRIIICIVYIPQFSLAVYKN